MHSGECKLGHSQCYCALGSGTGWVAGPCARLCVYAERMQTCMTAHVQQVRWKACQQVAIAPHTVVLWLSCPVCSHSPLPGQGAKQLATQLGVTHLCNLWQWRGCLGGGH